MLRLTSQTFPPRLWHNVCVFDIIRYLIIQQCWITSNYVRLFKIICYSSQNDSVYTLNEIIDSTFEKVKNNLDENSFKTYALGDTHIQVRMVSSIKNTWLNPLTGVCLGTSRVTCQWLQPPHPSLREILMERGS